MIDYAKSSRNRDKPMRKILLSNWMVVPFFFDGFDAFFLFPVVHLFFFPLLYSPLGPSCPTISFAEFL